MEPGAIAGRNRIVLGENRLFQRLHICMMVCMVTVSMVVIVAVMVMVVMIVMMGMPMMILMNNEYGGSLDISHVSPSCRMQSKLVEY